MSNPRKIPQPFAAGVANLGQLPDVADETTGRAGWSGGFPAVTAKPISAGGIPPHYNDFQMVLHEITEHTCWVQNGGRYAWDKDVVYDTGSVVVYNGRVWQCFSGGVQEMAGNAPASNSPYWAEVALVDNATIKTNSSGKAYVVASSMADGTTIKTNAGGKLYANVSGMAGAGLSASGGTLNVEYVDIASQLAGAGLAASNGQLKVVSSGGSTTNALTFKTAGTSRWAFNGASAATLDITGTASQINVGYTASNGKVTLSLAGQAVFPAGTVMLFRGTSAPAGWAAETGAAFNDAAIRIVNAASQGASSFAGSSFSNAFRSARATNGVPTAGTVAPFKLKVEHMPSHRHSMGGAETAGGMGTNYVDDGSSAPYGSNVFYTDSVGGNQPHSHGFTGSQHSHTVNLNVKCINAFFARKS